MRVLRVAPLARQDIARIVARSEAAFGRQSRVRYAALIERALTHLLQNPDRAGVKKRNELGKGYRTYHLQFSKVRGSEVGNPRHLIVFRVTPDTVDISRVLHDAMDIERHLPALR